MEFVEGSRGIYRPIRVLFDTPIYERALQTCWHMGSYKSQIALVTELLRLQQKKQLPSEVTAEDMTELLVEESKRTLRVQLWEFELEDFDEADVRPLLKLVWEVNTSMKMRDVEFEARRLLRSPEAAPPQFQHPKIISKAQTYARSMTEQQKEAPSSKLLGPREVVMEVVPKVLQGFWLPPPNTSFNMPSQQLCKMAVGVTKAVEDRVSTALSSMLCQVPYSRSIRDDLVLSIQEKVRQGHTRDVFVKRLNCFAAEVLNTITDVAAGEICALFQPQTHTEVTVTTNTRKDCIQPDVVVGAEAKTSPAEDVYEEPGLEEDTEPIREPDSAVITPPPAPLTTSAEPLALITVQNGLNSSLEGEEQPAPHPETDTTVVPAPPPPVTPADEPAVITAVNEDLTISQVKPVQQPAPNPEPDSAVLPAPPPLLTPPAEPPVTNSALVDEVVVDEPTREPDSAVISAPPPRVTPPAEVTASVLDGENKTEEPTREPDSAVVSAPPPPVTPPAVVPASVLDNECRSEEPTREPDSAVVSAPPPPVTPPAVVPASVLDNECRSEEPNREPDSALVSAPPLPVTPPAEVTASVLDGENKTEEPTREPDSAMVSAPPLPVTPPAVIPASVLEGESKSEEPTREPDSAVVSAPPARVTPPNEAPVISAEQDDLNISQDAAKMKTGGRTQRFFRWFRKTLCCCFSSEDAD